VEKPVPYNPLDKKHLGESVASALLQQPICPLPPERFFGAGIYAIYYTGSFEAYQPIAIKNRNKRYRIPIYVGKAIPSGARRGGKGLDSIAGAVLHRRLVEHGETIKAAQSLDIKDFTCRYLVVDDIWIPLGESLLIETHSPVWNSIVDGFGNHDPGNGRYQQQRSPWDMIHPGRSWAAKCKLNKHSPAEVLAKIAESFTR
jgi:hypothetical protein